MVVDETCMTAYAPGFGNILHFAQRETDKAVTLGPYAIHDRAAIDADQAVEMDAEAGCLADGMGGLGGGDEELARHAAHARAGGAIVAAFDDRDACSRGFGGAVGGDAGGPGTDYCNVNLRGVHVLSALDRRSQPGCCRFGGARLRAASLRRAIHFVLSFLPGGNLLLRLFLGDSVGLLDFAEKLFAPARDYVELIVGEFSPLLLDVALELLPVAFDSIPIHCELLVIDRLFPNKHKCRRRNVLFDVTHIDPHLREPVRRTICAAAKPGANNGRQGRMRKRRVADRVTRGDRGLRLCRVSARQNLLGNPDRPANPGVRRRAVRTTRALPAAP